MSRKPREGVAADPRAIYTAATGGEARRQLDASGAARGEAYPSTGQPRRRNWPGIIPFSDYPPEIREAIYTTDAIGPANTGLRKVAKNRGPFPGDGALVKLFCLALGNTGAKWTMPVRGWKAAPNRFAIQLGDRMPQH